MENNPLYRLAKKVLDEELTPEQALYQVTATDITRANLDEIARLAEQERERNPKASLVLSKLSLGWAEKIRLEQAILAKMNFLHGTILIRLLKLDMASNHIERAQKMFESKGMEFEVVDCNVEKANILLIKGHFEMAHQLLESARSTFERAGLMAKFARCCRGIGQILSHLGQHGRALEYLRSAKDLFHNEKMDADVARCDFDIGLVFENLEKYNDALKNFLTAKTIFAKMELAIDEANAEMSIARIHSTLGQRQKSIGLRKTARKRYEEGGVSIRVANCDVLLANQYLSDGKYNQALAHFESAKSIYAEENIRDEVARCQLAISQIYLRMEEFGEALELLKMATQFYLEAKLEVQVANCQMLMGYVNQIMGYYPAAFEELTRAIAFFTDRSMSMPKTMAEMYMANVYRDMGKMPWFAMDLYTSSRKVFEENGMAEMIAACDREMMLLHMALGPNIKPEDVEELYKVAKASLEAEGMFAMAAQLNMHMAMIYERNHKYLKARELLESAKRTYEQKKMEVRVAECNELLGEICLFIEDWGQALELLEAAKKKLVEYVVPDDIANIDRGLASAYLHLNQPKKAIELAESAREILEKSSLNILEAGKTRVAAALCTMNMANAYMGLGNLERAVDLFRSALEVFAVEGAEDIGAGCALNMAIAYQRLQQDDKASELLELAKNTFETRNNWIGAGRYEMLRGAIHFNCGRDKEALGAFQRAFEIFREIPELSWKPLAGMGALFQKRGDLERSKDVLIKAKEIVEDLWGAVPGEDLRTAFFESVSWLYHMLVDLSVEQKDFGGALEVLEEMKSRNLAEIFVRRELMPENATEEELSEYQRILREHREYTLKISKENDRSNVQFIRNKLKEIGSRRDRLMENLSLKDPTFDPHQNRKISCPEIKSILSEDGAAILELFPTEDKIIAFIVSGAKSLAEGTVVIRDCNYRDILHSSLGLIELYIRFLLDKDEEARVMWEKYLDRLLLDLHERLFLKIKPHLQGINKLFIIPYGVFHGLPLHAMYTEVEGRRQYLIDDYLIVYAPSAKILKFCKERKRVKKGKVVVAFANPEGTDRLSFSLAEARAIKEMFKGSQYIEEATRTDVISLGRTANILHYTGHADGRALALHDEEDRP